MNVVAYRLIVGTSLLNRSACPTCHTQLTWYQLVPLFSWLALRGRCASCKTPISWLYPMLELLTGITWLAFATLQPVAYWPTLFIGSSALLVTIRTDIEFLLILRYMTGGMLATGLVASTFGYLPLSFIESLTGAILGFAILWLVSKMFYLYKGQDGMGEGDPELLAAIGSFVGPWGVLLVLTIGSIAGSMVGLALLIAGKGSRETLKLPFGAFLALAALLVMLAPSYMHSINLLT